MARETVMILLTEAWSLVSNSAAESFIYQVTGAGGAVFALGDTAPSADSASGYSSPSGTFPAGSKVYGRALTTRATVICTRTADAGNPAIVALKDPTISATEFTTVGRTGATVAVVTNLTAGSTVTVRPRRIFQFVRTSDTSGNVVFGLTPAMGGHVNLELTEDLATAPNSPKTTVWSMTANAPVVIDPSALRPSLLLPPVLGTVGGGPPRVGSQAIITHGTWTNSTDGTFGYATNIDFAPSATGPWTSQAISSEAFTWPANGLGLYARVREVGINNYGTSIDVGISAVIGPIAAALIPGNIIPFDSVRQVNAGNIQRGVAFSYPLQYGQPDWSVAMNSLAGVSISGGANSATANLVGTIPATGGDDEILDLTFTCSKAGQADIVSKWTVLVSDNLYIPERADNVTGGRIVDENVDLQSFNQTAKTSKALTRSVGSEGQTVWRLALFDDGAGWSGDTVASNRYRSELQFGKQFNEGEEFNIAFRDFFVGFTQVDLANPTTTYVIPFQGHKAPTAGAVFVPPPMEGQIVYDAGVRKIRWLHKWNTEDNLKNVDIYGGTTKVVAGSLNVINFYTGDGVTPLKLPVKNGMAVTRNDANAPNVNDPPEGLEVISGGWDGVTDTGVTSVTVSANLTAATRQLLFRTNYHITKSPAIALPAGWHDFYYRGKYSLNGDGYLEIKMDGNVVYSASNLKFGYKHVGNDKPYYFKGGNYTNPRPGPNGFHIIDGPLMSGSLIPGLAGRNPNPFAKAATSAVITRTKDGSVGQTYTATVVPAGAAIQWVSITTGANPVTTVIAGATGSTYVATANEIGKIIGVRSAVGGATIGKALGPTFAAPIMLADFESLTGWSTGSFALSLDTVNKVQGTSSMLLASTDGGSGSPITEKAISGIDPSTLDVVVAGIYLDPNAFSNGTFELSYRRNNISAGIVASGGTHGFINDDSFIPGHRFVTAAIADNANVPTGVADGVIRLRTTPKAPGSGRLRVDSFMGNAGGRPTIVFTFDDGFRGPYTRVLPKFDEYGWKTTFYTPDRSVRTTIGDGTRLTWADVLDLDARGHDIACDSPDDTSYADHLENGVTSAVNWYLNNRQALVDHGVSNRALDHMCYPFGMVTIPPVYARVTSATAAGGSPTITFAAAPSSPVTVGMTLSDGFWAEAGLATVTAVAGDGLSVTMDRNITARSGKAAIFVDQTGPMYKRKFAEALRAAGVKTARCTSIISPEHQVTRYGWPDISAMVMPAKGFTGQRFATMKAYIDDAFKFKSTNILYLHDTLLDSETNQSINVYASDVIQALDYAKTTYVDTGLMDVLSISQLWARDGGASLPF